MPTDVIDKKLYKVFFLSIFFLTEGYLMLNGSIRKDAFQKILILQNHQFDIKTNESGAIRELTLKVSRNNQSLITIRQKTDGWVVNAEVADLDNNNAPEVYIYACSYGTGAFGKVYAFQFYPANFEPIVLETLSAAQSQGYMGHDIFDIENKIMVRRFPIYKAGDSNVRPTGGTRTIQYKLTRVEQKLYLKSIL